MSIHYILYASGASRPISPEDIDQILTASRRNNAALGVFASFAIFAVVAIRSILVGYRLRASGCGPVTPTCLRILTCSP